MKGDQAAFEERDGYREQEELSMKKRPRNVAESRKAGIEPLGSSKEQDSGIQGHLLP